MINFKKDAQGKPQAPYIIAEVGANHNGDMDIAKQLVLQAKEAGADCVKFQSWSKNSVFSSKKYQDNYFLNDDYRNRTDYTLAEIVEKYCISENQLLEMKKLADTLGIDCTSTPFCNREVDFLVDVLDPPFIKVASMDINNLPFLKYIAQKGKPIIIATGLSELHEIDSAVRTIEATGNTNISILHCVATYPPLDSDVNLNNIVTLQKTYPMYPIGFSDHTIGIEIPLAAVALGATVIEKHFTLDKNLEGWDHKVSATRDELANIVTGAKRIHAAMGSFRILAPESDEKKLEFRRSIVLTRDMKKNEILTKEDLSYKRPGIGIKPELSEFIIGLKINKDLPQDHILEKKDLI